MHTFRIAMFILVAVGFLLSFASCDSMAITGDKKYKADMSNALQNLKNEIEQNGSVSDRRLKKLERVLAGYEADYSKKGSYIFAKEAVASVHDALEDPANEFKKLTAASSSVYQALNCLTTEIKD